MGDRSGKEERKRVKRFLGDERAERADEQVRSLEASSVAMDDARELQLGGGTGSVDWYRHRTHRSESRTKNSESGSGIGQICTTSTAQVQEV